MTARQRPQQFLPRYLDIEVDSGDVLRTHHFIPDADPAPYAESFVDKDEMDIAAEFHIEIAVGRNETEVTPEPHVNEDDAVFSRNVEIIVVEILTKFLPPIMRNKLSWYNTTRILLSVTTQFVRQCSSVC